MKNKKVKLEIYRKALIYKYPFQKSPLRISTGQNPDVKYIKNNKLSSSFFNKNPTILSNLEYINKQITLHVIEKNQQPSREEVRRIITSVNESIKDQNNTILDYFERFYIEKKTLTEIKTNSMKPYQSLWNSLIDFEKFTKKIIVFEDFEKDFVIEYNSFVRSEHNRDEYKTGGNLNNNTLKKRYASLKVFFNWMIDKGIIKSIPSKIRKEQFSVDVEKPFLTPSEIMGFYNYNCGTDSKNRVKDIFVFLCMTGMRHIDVINLNQHHFILKENKTYVQKRSEKIGKFFYLELTNIANDIRLRLDHDFVISNQAFNRILKEIGEESKLFDGIFFNQVKNKKFKMYEVLSSHIGRHSFITNLVDAKYPINQIMRMTGHTKPTTLFAYINRRLTSEINMNELYK